MAALPYMQFHVAEYLADTHHLSTEENGAYLLLIFNYWQRGKPLKDCNERLANIARLSNERWIYVRETLEEFFIIEDNLWKHKRIERDLASVKIKCENASKAGKASAYAKSKRSLDGRSISVEQNFNHKNRKEENRKEEKGKDSDEKESEASAPPPKPPFPISHEHKELLKKYDLKLDEQLKIYEEWCAARPNKLPNSHGFLMSIQIEKRKAMENNKYQPKGGLLVSPEQQKKQRIHQLKIEIKDLEDLKNMRIRQNRPEMWDLYRNDYEQAVNELKILTEGLNQGVTV